MLHFVYTTLKLAKTPLCALLVSVIGVAIISWLLLSIMANIDAADGRYMLFMDEIISFDGAQKIVNSSNIPELVANLSGPDQRYGRTFWYAAALPTLLLEGNFGAAGQIIGTRVWFSIILLVGIALITLSLVKKPLPRLLVFSSCLCIPYVDYFSTMPKPEPIALLSIGLFALTLTRSSSWLLFSTFALGVAFGTKISILPAVCIFLIFAYVYSCVVFQTPAIKTFIYGLVVFLLGFLIAVPIIILDFPNGLELYVEKTWNNRGHGRDSVAVDFFSWAAAIKKSAFFGAGSMTFFVLAIQLSVPLGLFINLLRTRSEVASESKKLNVTELLTHQYFFPLLFSVTGTLLCLSIMFTANRLWLMYLFMGVLFINIAFWSVIFTALGSTLKKPIKGTLLLLSIVVTSSYFNQFDHVYNGFYKQALRSEGSKFKTAESDYKLVMDLADRLIKQNKASRTEIHFSAHLWHPSSNASVYFAPVYGFFKAWSRAPDAIILPRHHVNRAEYNFTGIQLDEAASRFFDELNDHDSTLGKCTQHPCYERLEFDGSNYIALTLIPVGEK